MWVGQEWKHNWKKMEPGERVWRVEASAKEPGQAEGGVPQRPCGSVLGLSWKLWLIRELPLCPWGEGVAWGSTVWRLCEWGG